MPRANQCFLPDYLFHITHRCHKREFLRKFARTRQRFLHWLYQTRRRFAVEVLNDTVTSNHVHLIVRNRGGENEVPAMIQLVAGRSAQEQGVGWSDPEGPN